MLHSLRQLTERLVGLRLAALLKALQRTVVDRLLPPESPNRLARPILPLASSEHAVSVRVVELAIEIIDLRLELGVSRLDLSEPLLERDDLSRRRWLGRPLQERQR